MDNNEDDLEQTLARDDVRVLQLHIYQILMGVPDRLKSCDLVNTLIMLSHDVAIAKMGEEAAANHLFRAAVDRWPSVLADDTDAEAKAFEDYFDHEPIHSKKKH